MIRKCLGVGMVQAVVVAAIALVVFFLCRPGDAANTNFEMENGEYFTVNMLGYNYTDYDIQSYSVNSQGGGNISVSGPTSGGSGIVCCVQLPKTYKNYWLNIRWQVGGCVYTARDPFSNSTQELYHFYHREVKVKVPRPEGIKPVHLETHFYADGSVQAQITENISFPRMRLSDSRRKNFQYPRCQNDKKPE